MSGNLIASRMKKTLRLLPTRSQLPSTVLNLIAKPRGSRAVSGESLEPITVENRMNTGVCTPAWVSTLARVYLEAGSLPILPYASKYPWAAVPRACTTRSGIRSRSKWVIFSMN